MVGMSRAWERKDDLVLYKRQLSLLRSHTAGGHRDAMMANSYYASAESRVPVFTLRETPERMTGLAKDFGYRKAAETLGEYAKDCLYRFGYLNPNNLKPVAILPT